MKVLQVIGGLNRGGAETFIMNVLRNIDRKSYQFIFLCYGYKRYDYEEEAVKLGAKVIRIPDIKPLDILKYISSIRKIIKDESIDAIHVHTYYNSMFALIAAKMSGVKIRITHSHSTQSEANPPLLKKCYFWVSSTIIGLLTTVRLACGEAAGKALFGKRKFTVINNGINIKDFSYSRKMRGNIRKQLNISPDCTVLLHVGRFEVVKNHDFLIDVYDEYRKLNPNSILLLTGRGPTEQNIKRKVRTLGLDDNVRFLGVRSDVKDIMSAADLFVFPSLFEGLPVVLVEAQASGLRIAASDTIDSSVKLTSTVNFYSIKKSAKDWASWLYNIDSVRLDTSSDLIDGPYDINNTVLRLQEIYQKGVSI